MHSFVGNIVDVETFRTVGSKRKSSVTKTFWFALLISSWGCGVPVELLSAARISRTDFLEQ